MNALFGSSWYAPKGPQKLKPALSYSFCAAVKAAIDPGPFRESFTRHLIGLEHLLRHRLSVLGHQIVSQTQFGIHFKKL